MRDSTKEKNLLQNRKNMSTLQIMEDALNELGAFEEHRNPIAEKMMDALGDEVPEVMGLLMANFMIASFANHSRIFLALSPTNHIPSNLVAFILARSGDKKTSSILKLEACIRTATGMMHQRNAMDLAQTMGDDFNEKLNPPFSNMLATEAGMIKRLNTFHPLLFGTPYLFVDEISTELATNTDMVPNIKLVAQLFDVGDMKSKPLKDSENQSDEIHGMGMSALFIGSELVF